jgi:hypothetical protein
MKSKKSNKDLKKNEFKNHTATKNNSGTTKVRQRQKKTKSLEGELEWQEEKAQMHLQNS